MKAEHILSSNLISRNIIRFKFLGKLGKIGFFKIFAKVVERIFFFKIKIFNIFEINCQNSCSTIVSNTKNENYMKVWQPKLHPSQNRKPSNTQCLDSAPSRPFKGLRPPTLTGHSFPAPWATMMNSTSFESLKAYQFAHYLIYSILALLRYVILAQSNPISVVLML